jgi:hypothetical protein
MIETVISFAGNTFYPDYEVDFVQGTQPRLPPAQVETLERIGAWPVIAALSRKAHKLALLIKILDYANLDTLRSQLFRWFDPEDETPKKLIVENGAGVQQYVYALCEELRLYSDPRHQDVFVATLTVDGDPRWRAEVEATDTWNITASGQTQPIVNLGEDDAYPVYTIEPTTNRTGGYAYRRWVPIQWLSANAAQKYPMAATLATNALIPAKMQADGDDLRVVVDGVEVYRWLDAASWNSGASKVWFYTDFVGAPALTLKTTIAAGGAVSSIEINEDISKLPDSGILLIGTEAFVYSSRSTIDRAVSGVERAAKGTTAAQHLATVSVYWIQHDVWIVYGNASVSAPTVDNDYKPAFELDHSTNTSWVYETFGDTAGKRTGRWTPSGAISLCGWGGVYTATQRTLATPYSVIGAWLWRLHGNSYGWGLYNPCGITNAAWTNGWKRRATTLAGADFLCHLMYWVRGETWWRWMDTPASPTLLNTWEAMSYSGGAFAVSNTIMLALYFYASDVEAGDVTVTLNNTETPVVTVNALEQGNYSLACIITNTSVTPNEAITLQIVTNLNSEVEIDTYNRTVTWLLDGSRQFQALTVPTTRRAWLRLLPGTNTLRFDDTGTGDVTLTTKFAERYY